jgi:hypothetical protein
MQTQLDEIGNYAGAIEQLFWWSQRVGYLDIEALKQNPRFQFMHPESGVTLKSQVNIVRSLYSESQLKTQPKYSCPICFSLVDSEEKPLLRAWEINFPNNKRFFLQFSPFPLAAKHIVIIEKKHGPMRMDAASIADLLYFLDQAPTFTALSNSDVVGAGASVNQHHHYQAIDNFQLPIMQAQAITDCKKKLGNTTVQALNFPMASLKLTSDSHNGLITVAGPIIQRWKQLDPGVNTWNFALKKIEHKYALWLIARSSKHQTSPQYHHIKREGLGIVEVAGEAIYPTPKGKDAAVAWQQIRQHGLTTFLGILKDNNPLSSKELWSQVT